MKSITKPPLRVTTSLIQECALQKQTNIEQDPFPPKIQYVSEAGNSGVKFQVKISRNLFFLRGGK